MGNRQAVVDAGSIDVGVTIVTSMGPGIVVVDLLHVIPIRSMSLHAWSVFFEELTARAGEHVRDIGVPVVALWAVGSITNARLARRLGVPLVAAERIDRTTRSTWSRRIATALLLERR